MVKVQEHGIWLAEAIRPDYGHTIVTMSMDGLTLYTKVSGERLDSRVSQGIAVKCGLVRVEGFRHDMADVVLQVKVGTTDRKKATEIVHIVHEQLTGKHANTRWFSANAHSQIKAGEMRLGYEYDVGGLVFDDDDMADLPPENDPEGGWITNPDACSNCGFRDVVCAECGDPREAG